jgi:hypothetical protein
MVLAELLDPERLGLGPSILAKVDSRQLETEAIHAGMVGRWLRACHAIEAGRTSPAEVRRVLGFAEASDVRENFDKL